MEIKINIEECLKLNITPGQYVLAYLIKNKLKEEFRLLMDSYRNPLFFKEDLLNLVLNKYLIQETVNLKKIIFNECKIVDLFDDLPLEDGKDINVPTIDETSIWSDFVSEFREHFPKGVYSGNYRVRSSFKDCEAKLKKFSKDYPEYDAEIILKATENYIKRFKIKGYGFMQLAVNFVSKDKISTLASECEGVLEGGETKSMFSNGI